MQNKRQETNQQITLDGPSEASVMRHISFFSTPPVYATDSSRLAGVLQLLQVSVPSICGDLTLADAISMIEDLQATHGALASLEEVIQTLVGHQLNGQVARRHTQCIEQEMQT